MRDVLSLPFDQYQRYRLVADLIGQIRVEQQPFHILDVGGRTALLREFLPKDRVTLVDLEPSSEHALVLGDGSRLPFKDGTFDIVTGFDTLEHVPPPHRAAFVTECARVSHGWVFLAGPYQAPEVDEAEELLVEFLAQKLGTRHRYLAEHRANGLPSRADVEATLEGLGGEVASFGHGNLERWLTLMCMELYMDEDPGLRPIAERFFRFYNRTLYASDHAQPVYRHVVVAALGGAPLPTGKGTLAAPVAPPGMLKVVTEMGLELIAFDRDKDVRQVELDRLAAVIEGLEGDLAGHRARLADRTSDLTEHEAALVSTRAELATARKDHAAEQGALESDLREHMRSLAEAHALAAKAACEHAEVRAASEAELREHAQALADLRQLETELRAVALETSAGARAIEAELGAAREECAGMGRHIEHLDGVVGELRATLRNRADNLKRAFGKRPEL
ncbi:MAG: methyltransferase domain-containing protein [Planctomycetota bacterium]|nr:MAG: methyltransferase domain-containing protein [Planctomycetota bacterium]